MLSFRYPDRFTGSPDMVAENYEEAIMEHFSPGFYGTAIEEKDFNYHDAYVRWFGKLLEREVPAEQAAAVIERAYYRFILKPDKD